MPLSRLTRMPVHHQTGDTSLRNLRRHHRQHPQSQAALEERLYPNQAPHVLLASSVCRVASVLEILKPLCAPLLQSEVSRNNLVLQVLFYWVFVLRYIPTNSCPFSWPKSFNKKDFPQAQIDPLNLWNFTVTDILLLLVVSSSAFLCCFYVYPPPLVLETATGLAT